MANIISIRTVAFKDWVLYLQDNTTIYRLTVAPFPQGSPQGLRCAAVQQIQCILQPWEMERGLHGCQGVSPVGSDLRKGRLTVDAAAAASFPSLLFVLSLLFHLSCLFLLLLAARSTGNLGSPTRDQTRTPCIECWEP